jgi:peptidoglycan/xylan/chitin deacetylase (PgdA/CDA1 family)
MISLLLTMVLVSNCSSLKNKPEHDVNIRIPASVEEGEIAVSSVESENESDLRSIVEDRNSRRLDQLLLAMRIAQSLVASFDERMESAQGSAGTSAIMRSKLYCKLIQVRSLHHQVEMKLEKIFHFAFNSGEEAVNWIAQDINQFAKLNTANQVTMGNILRHLNYQKALLCPAGKECVSDLIKQVELPFDVLGDADFANYTSNHRSDIASYSALTDNDLAAGSCFESDMGRIPNQETFNWSKNHWIRSNLNNGEFVVTYDDGPHHSYTQRIKDHWENSKMAKPAFFWLASNVKRYKNLSQKTLREGFAIGSHSFSHADLGNLARASSKGDLNRVNRNTLGASISGSFSRWREKTLDHEILASSQYIEKVMGEVDPSFKLRFFRLPFGSGVKNNSIGGRFLKQKLNHYFWKVDSLDWQDKNPSSIHSRVTSQMRSSKRGLILFHDIQPQTIEATRLLITTFKKTSKWKPVSINRMLP